MRDGTGRIGHAAAILAILERERTMAPPLTTELLRDRIDSLADAITDVWPDEAGPVIDAFAIVRCDRCGAEHDILADPTLDGWTTNQSRMGNWTDLCKACSQ